MKGSYLKIIFLLLPQLFLAQLTEAQFGLNLASLPNHPNSQWMNPAHISQQSFTHIQLDASGNFWLSNNRFDLVELVREGNFLSNSTKDAILSQLNEDNRFQQGSEARILLNFKLGQQNWLVSYQRGQSLFIGVEDSVSAGLFLRGNAPYAGMEISDDEVAWRSLSYQAFGVGSSWEYDNFSWGVHLKLLQGIRTQWVDELAYTLFTAQDGSSISLDAQYSTLGTLTDNQGWGVGMDLGLQYVVDEYQRIEASVNSLGNIRWEGSKSENDVSIDYEGVLWDNFLTNSGSTSNLALGDTLQELLFPDSVQTTFNTPFPSFARIAYHKGLLSTGLWGITLIQGLSNWAPQTPLPLLNVSYARGGKYVKGGINGYVGGMEGYGLGLWGEGDIPFKDESHIGIYLSVPNVLGLAIPEISRGLDVRGGLFFRW